MPILILSDEPVVAALVGLLVEMAGRQPVFANPDETTAEALDRLRPRAVVLVDCALDVARSDLFFAKAAQKHTGVIVFGPDASAHRIGEIAAERSIPWLVLPPTADDVADAIAAVAQQPTRRTDERRRRELRIFPDGTPMVSDDEGRRWMVYDRRAAHDRRSVDAHRIFVAVDGERREVVVNAPDSSSPTAATLLEQLQRATLI